MTSANKQNKGEADTKQKKKLLIQCHVKKVRSKGNKLVQFISITMSNTLKIKLFA